MICEALNNPCCWVKFCDDSLITNNTLFRVKINTSFPCRAVHISDIKFHSESNRIREVLNFDLLHKYSILVQSCTFLKVNTNSASNNFS